MRRLVINGVKNYKATDTYVRVGLTALLFFLALSPKAGAQNFFNQGPASYQMGYDYTWESNAHSAGMKQMFYVGALDLFIRQRDGSYSPASGMTTDHSVPSISEYDQYTCIRDAGQTKPELRYYISWINACGDPSWCGAGASPANAYTQLSFFANFQSKAALDGAVSYYANNIDWTKVDGIYLDEMEPSFPYFNDSPNHIFDLTQGESQFGPGGEIAACNNPVAKDFSTLSDGWTYYVKQLVAMFHQHNAMVLANVWSISGSWGQYAASNFPIDGYFNESGTNNNASGFGLIAADKAVLDLPDPYPWIYWGYTDTLNLAGVAAAQGSWYGYGNCCGNWPWMDVGVNGVQLLHAIPNWDNLLSIPLTSRSWNGSVYSSPNSYADANIAYGRNAKTGQLYAVFVNAGHTIQLRSGESISGVQCVDGNFVASGDCAGQLIQSGNTVSLASTGQLNHGYILTLSGSGAPPPPPPIQRPAAPAGVQVL